MNHRCLLDRYPFLFIGTLALTLALGCAPTGPEVQPDGTNDRTDAGAEVFDTFSSTRASRLKRLQNSPCHRH